MSRFRPKTQILPPSQKALWPALRGSTELGFVLYGGTAIGLRLGHRQSVDFDFFSEKPLDRDSMNRAFPFLAGAAVLQEEPNTLVVLSPQNDPPQAVKLSFFGDITFGRVGTPQLTEDGTLEVASLIDLLATKVKVVLQRIEAKDYKDVAALARAGVSLESALASARKMFAPSFQPSESLKALAYHQGGDLDELSQLDRDTLIQAVREVRDLPDVQIISRELSTVAADR